jgi:hypothetical protein
MLTMLGEQQKLLPQDKRSLKCLLARSALTCIVVSTLQAGTISITLVIPFFAG